jgi:hypothetical protein
LGAGCHRKFLEHILQELPKPTATVAAGHAAGYLLAHAAEHPGSVGKVVSRRTYMARVSAGKQQRRDGEVKNLRRLDHLTPFWPKTKGASQRIPPAGGPRERFKIA